MSWVNFNLPKLAKLQTRLSFDLTVICGKGIEVN